jgi:coenzyme PQQ biosynthesis protein PqqD
MDLTKIVKLKEGYFLERLDDEITVYHPTLTTAVYLNDTGALIWELCDGRRTISDIVEVLYQQYPESNAQIETDVKNLIIQLIERDIAALE